MILDINISIVNIHQYRNSLNQKGKWYPKGKVFITDGWGVWFAITTLYEKTNHIDSYWQVAFHKISAIKFFDKNIDKAIIDVVFNNFNASIRKYNHVGCTLDALDEHTCLTLIKSIINLIANLLQNIKICEKIEN